MSQITKLLSPVKVGDLSLKNRVVMSAMTRCRADYKTAVPNDLHVQYYSQRAESGFILTECSPITPRSGAFPGAAGIWSEDQVKGWRKVTEAVHNKGGHIFLQIWHSGRATHSAIQGGLEPWAPSPIAIRGVNFLAKVPHEVPHEMTQKDIDTVKEEFRRGALNAKKAGFDGVELHGANGYLVDQFLRTNQRKDKYGGSPENNSRFGLELIDLLSEVFGNQRVGIKISPVGRYNDMYVENVKEIFTHFVKELNKRNIAFLELMENNDPENVFNYGLPSSRSQIADPLSFIRALFSGPLIGNEGYTPELAEEKINKGQADLVSFARLYLSNPDLVSRIAKQKPLNRHVDPQTFYSPGPKGYTDYPTWQEEEAKTAN